MTDVPTMNVRLTRMLLIRAGLNDDEADAFLERLAHELRADALSNEEARLRFIEEALANLSSKRTTSSREKLKNFLIGVVAGVVSNALTAGAVHELSEQTAPPTPVPTPTPTPAPWPKDWPTEIILEWAGATPWAGAADTENLQRKAIELYGNSRLFADQKTAVLLDALAMCLDAEGRHREAVDQRMRVLRIERSLHGANSYGVGAALSNLAISLMGWGQYREAEKHLVKSLKIMKGHFGSGHLSTAIVTFNLYFNLKAQGRLRGTSLPKAVLLAEPSIRAAAQEMMARKHIFITFNAAHEAIEGLKPLMGLQ